MRPASLGTRAQRAAGGGADAAAAAWMPRARGAKPVWPVKNGLGIGLIAEPAGSARAEATVDSNAITRTARRFVHIRARPGLTLGSQASFSPYRKSSG